MKVLITGGHGNLGTELVKQFYRDCTVVAPSHHDMDIADMKAVADKISSCDVNTIVHAAAMTDVRKCETDWTLAYNVNVKGTYNVTVAAHEMGVKLIHISTACVFDGENAPFHEYSKPGPKNWYAQTKLSAEQIVRLITRNSLVVRTNFVPRRPWPYPKAFTDRFGSYLFADDVAYAIHELSKLRGIVHICGEARMSMYDLARIVSPNVQPMTMCEYQGPPLTRDMTLVSKRVFPFEIGCAHDIFKS